MGIVTEIQTTRTSHAKGNKKAGDHRAAGEGKSERKETEAGRASGHRAFQTRAQDVHCILRAVRSHC